jgi:hypothetical protein
MANSFSINQNLLENVFQQSNVLGPTGYNVVTDLVGIRNIIPNSDQVVIGNGAGSNSTGTYRIAIGGNAGNGVTSSSTIAIGANAGVGVTGGNNSIAIGTNSGYSQGDNSIAIGYFAGGNNIFGTPQPQASNTIILNASGSIVSGNSGTTGCCYVKPIRGTSLASLMSSGFTGPIYYNPTTSEIAYSTG